MSSKIEKAGRVQQISDEEWGKMKEMITEQLDSVTSDLSTLRENGSLETIAQMIQRGDRCPSARIQAWYHAMLEAEFLNRPHSVAQKLQFMYRTHASAIVGPDDTPQSFILDTNLTQQSSANEEWKRRGGRPLEQPQAIVSRLEKVRKPSVVERQELWLAKKNIKADKTKAEIEEKKMQELRANTAPRRPSTVSRPRKRSIASTDTATRYLNNLTNQTEAKRQKTKTTGQAISTNNGGPICDFGQRF